MREGRERVTKGVKSEMKGREKSRGGETTWRELHTLQQLSHQEEAPGDGNGAGT